ncbi:Crp/Fnr family transcriptional regulator [Saccharothrix espanaensis]|uniref:Crp/Fnr family transcriptional regulator n=1 Tax=Saccharothrix espanaensis TaxID=103731 RepID=UPI0002E60396|nr:Crp/Fnr family transcriptional regulator [Saccharothrix espanaensis]
MGGKVFAGRVRAADLRALVECGRTVRYAPGDHLMRQGDPGDCVLLVGSGRVKVVARDGAGHERLLGIRGSGELLGEMSCVDDGPRSASVVAHDPVSATKIAKARFMGIMGERPAIAREVVRQVSQRLRDAERKQSELTSDSVDTRVARVLAELVGLFADDSALGPRGVTVPLGQEELAQLAAASHVSAQRALRGLRARGLVTTGYGRVDIPCLGCFTALSGLNPAKDVRGCGGRGACPQG